MRKLHWIYDNRIYNFLWENGVKPQIEEENRAGYRRTEKFCEVLESFQIQFYIFPNKH